MGDYDEGAKLRVCLIKKYKNYLEKLSMFM